MPRSLSGGEHAHGVGADGEKGHVAQVQQAGKADHDVQAQAHQDVEAHLVDHLGQIGVHEERQGQHAG